MSIAGREEHRWKPLEACAVEKQKNDSGAGARRDGGEAKGMRGMDPPRASRGLIQRSMRQSIPSLEG